MASMRDIKRRKESITSTSQITKAMKLVATVKLQKAKERAEKSKPYFNRMYETMVSVLALTDHVDHPCLVERQKENKQKGVIFISSNRGLAGGYNSNMVKLITKGDFSREDTVIYPIGRKGKEALERNGFRCEGDYAEVMNEPLFSDASQIGAKVMESYINEEIDEIYLAYTNFKNTVKHEPTLVKLLPINTEELISQKVEDESNRTLMNYEAVSSEEVGVFAPGTTVSVEGDSEEDSVLDQIIPLYVNSLIYGALVEAVASENGARMQAMDSATSNAEEMIDKLGLQYNRARQASITQELTEIVAGASAIE